jgi:hypothetical protein
VRVARSRPAKMALVATSHLRRFLPANLRALIQVPRSRARRPCPRTFQSFPLDAGAGPRPHSNPHSTGAADSPPHRGFLVWALSSDKGLAHLFSCVSFFVRSRSPFLRPDRVSLMPPRAEAVKVGRRTNLTACSAFARPHLDSFEHDGTLGAIGMTIRGEPAFGRRGSSAPQPCIRWVQEPEP